MVLSQNLIAEELVENLKNLEKEMNGVYSMMSDEKGNSSESFESYT